MTARDDLEFIVRTQLTRLAAIVARGDHMPTQAMNDAAYAIIDAADAYAARCIAQPVSDVADHPLITAGRRQAAVAEADAKIGRRPARNRKERT